jgi:hypothetical protein
MVDFARLGVAAEKVLGFEAGDFLSSYLENRRNVRETLLEGSAVAIRLRQFMRDRLAWDGTSTDLLAELNALATDHEKRRRSWPSVPQALSGMLTRLAPSLRQIGIEVGRGHGHKERYIELHTIEVSSSRPAQASRGDAGDYCQSNDSGGFNSEKGADGQGGDRDDPRRSATMGASPEGSANCGDSIGASCGGDERDDSDNERATHEPFEEGEL